jgi:phosphomannomutase
MDKLRAWKPTAIGGKTVKAIRDYERKIETTVSSGAESPLTLPKSNVLAWDLDGGSRIVARPSGTEPKAKFYFDVREPVAAAEPLKEAEARAEKARSALEKAFFAESGVSAG